MHKALDLEALRATLHGAPIGHTIHYHSSVTSTMPLAHALAADPTVRSGTIVVAEEQTAGRGRLQRRWETPPGTALLVSLLLKAPLPVEPTQVPMVAGLALVQACISWQPQLAGQVGLKWPNDLLLGRDPRRPAKVAGILVESSYRGSEVGHVVAGMGLNVLQMPEQLPQALPDAPPPTSLRHFLTTQMESTANAHWDRTALLIALCRAWAELLQPAQQPLLVDKWRAHLWTLGQPVAVHGQGGAGVIYGVAVDINGVGHLVVEEPTGQRHTFAAGDVSLRSAPAAAGE